MNKEFIYIEEKKDGHKIRKIYREVRKYYADKCIWKKSVEDPNATTSMGWNEDHPCIKCGGYNINCKNYVSDEK